MELVYNARLMKELTGSMRIILLAAAALNTLGAITFCPLFPDLLQRANLPAAPPAYLWMFSIWILIFGLGYLWLALSRTFDRTFIATSAAGKLTFSIVIVAFAAMGQLPSSAITSGIGDLVFGSIFVFWLLRK